MRAFFTAFARNKVFANIILLIFGLAGTLAAMNMVNETFPEFSLDMIVVNVVWPGADPEEVEEGIVRKIEEAVEGIEGIKQYNGIANESAGVVVIEVSEKHDVDEVKERVRNAVDGISTFPEDAEQPITEEILLREEVLMVALSGEGISERTLKEWAESIKEELRTLPEVSQVQVLGARDYEISIEVSEQRLREYGLTFAQVSSAIRGNSLNLSGGTMRTAGEEIRLRTIGRKYTGEEISKIVVLARPDGEIITLDRIATVKDAFTEDPIVARFNGHPTATVAVLKTTDEDALAIDKAVKAYAERKQLELPEGIEINVWGTTADILQARIDLLVENGIQGLILVFVLLWLFLDFRLSFWVTMGIPTSILGTLALMYFIGETINMISLFAMIMVLGINVDDAIVLSEAIYVARKNGAPPLRAAVDGVMEVGLPIIASVSTTITCFIPLMFIGGIAGKFIAIMPIVVISCLVISVMECFLLFPAHLSHLPDPNVERVSRNPFVGLMNRIHKFTNRGLEGFVVRYYTPAIGSLLRARYVTAAGAIAALMLTGGLVASGIVKFELFPKMDSDVLTATIEFPNGTPLDITSRAVNQVEQAIEQVSTELKPRLEKDLILNKFTIVGSAWSESNDPPRTGNQIGSVRVQLLPSEQRDLNSDEITVAWEKAIGTIPGVTSLSFAGLEAGVPGAPIEIWLQGHHMETILAAATQVKERLAQYDGVYQIRDDFRPGKNEIKLTLKPEARALGLSVSDLARQVYAGYFGEEAIRLQRGRDDIRVRVRYTSEERTKVAEFEHVRIRTPQGREVPLLSVANVTYGPGYSSIRRTDGMRKVAIYAELDATKNVKPNEIISNFETAAFPLLREQFPDVQMSFQGEKKKMAESLEGLNVTYPLALVAMFIIIATAFRSYTQPFVVLMTVPFGFMGAIFGHLLFGYEVSFMSMMGMVTLSGVVVNDTIVLIDCVNEYVSRGDTFLNAVRLGGARRFRSIFLTSVCTVLGVMPLVLERDIQARFLIPMAISISAGVAFATLITLILTPCALVILNDIRRINHRLFHGKWPTREDVEPARHRNDDHDEEMLIHTPPVTGTA